MKRTISIAINYTLLINLFILGCSPSEKMQICSADSGIMLEFGSCLVFEDSGLNTKRDAIEVVVRETISLVNNKMAVENLKIRIKTAPSDVIPEIGLGGFNPNEHEVIISVDPDFSDLEQTIATELAPLLAHEMHHAKRRRAIGYGSTLLEASVSEGLADCFAMEITGIAPPAWSVALTGTALEDWIETAENTWTNSPYDHGQWFLGSTPDIPRWTGYAIGFKLVKDFLSENPTRKASDLFNEPANSFAQ